MAKLKKVWTNTAIHQLKAIYQYYKLQSVQTANTVKNEIFQAINDLHFAEQYQQDDIEPECRRIIVRHYKLLYIKEEGVVFILRIFDTRQNPNKQIE
jgi:plasmid stabilization system protein ParE